MNTLLAIIILVKSTYIWPLFDIWPEPTMKRYISLNRQYMLEVEPTKIPAKYRKWQSSKPNRRSKFNAADTTIIYCHAKLFRTDSKDTIKLWEQKFINETAPGSVHISNDGQYIVTFGNWYISGEEDEMVVYNGKGELSKRYNLEEFSPFPTDTYRSSITKIHWRCEVDFISNNKLKICFEDEKNQRKFRIYDLAKLEFEL